MLNSHSDLPSMSAWVQELGLRCSQRSRSRPQAAAARHRKVDPGRPATPALPSRGRRAARSRSWRPRMWTTSIRGRRTTRSATPVPDLAEGDPQISKDNKTITVKLRSGVKFSPPVDREVTSKDVKYAFERAFTQNVPSGYATSYFGDIKGAPKAPGKFQAIPGIKTPDDQTLVIELTKPTAVTVAAALVMPITIPVPREYAEKYDKKNPSTYDQYTVFTGPYMVRNDESGKVVGRDPRSEEHTS